MVSRLTVLVWSQVLIAMNMPYATLKMERQLIDQLRHKVNRHKIQDAIERGEIVWEVVLVK